MNHRLRVIILATVVGLAFGAAAAAAQTSESPPPAGAFESLSPGNQKIARALFQAQPAEPVDGTAPLTLDQIAGLKQGGQGWGEVFKSMRAQGLVQEKNLGQVVSGYNHRQNPATSGTVTTGSNRTEPARRWGASGKESKGESAADSPKGHVQRQGGGHAYGMAGQGDGRGAGGGHGAGVDRGAGKGKGK